MRAIAIPSQCENYFKKQIVFSAAEQEEEESVSFSYCTRYKFISRCSLYLPRIQSARSSLFFQNIKMTNEKKNKETQSTDRDLTPR